MDQKVEIEQTEQIASERELEGAELHRAIKEVADEIRDGLNQWPEFIEAVRKALNKYHYPNIQAQEALEKYWDEGYLWNIDFSKHNTPYSVRHTRRSELEFEVGGNDSSDKPAPHKIEIKIREEGIPEFQNFEEGIRFFTFHGAYYAGTGDNGAAAVVLDYTNPDKNTASAIENSTDLLKRTFHPSIVDKVKAIVK